MEGSERNLALRLDALDRARVSFRAFRRRHSALFACAAQILTLSLGIGAFAESRAWCNYVADFSTPAAFDAAASTGVWNTLTQQVEAAFAVGGAAGKELDFGNGSDGAFSDGPAQTGITISGSVITFHTDLKSTYRFSGFALSAGKTISVTGTAPLTLRVLGAVTIAGAIHANGSVGGVNLNASNAGGAAGPGGFAGGAGGATGGAPLASKGQPAGGAGGGIGAYATTTTNDQGGGGGCNGQNNSGGTDAANDAKGGNANLVANPGACASNRNTVATAFDAAFAGGAGGGGGGAYSVTWAGAGGGGGGGAIHFVALGSISFSGGTLTADGGAGGPNTNGDGADCGGGGGGGSGGSLWFQTAGNISGPGTVTANAGAGGTDSNTCFGSYNGGPGSIGVIRVDTQSGTSAFFADYGHNPVSVASGATYDVYSKAISVGSTLDTLGTPIESVACGANGTLSVLYEGSNEGTTFANPVPKSQISSLDGYPYLRFHVAIHTTGANPPCLAGLTIPIVTPPGPSPSPSPQDLSDFKLKGGMYCATISNGRNGSNGGDGSGPSGPSSWGGALQALGDFGLLFLACLIAKRTQRPRSSQRAAI